MGEANLVAEEFHLITFKEVKQNSSLLSLAAYSVFLLNSTVWRGRKKNRFTVETPKNISEVWWSRLTSTEVSYIDVMNSLYDVIRLTLCLWEHSPNNTLPLSNYDLKY